MEAAIAQIQKEQNEQALLINATVTQFSTVTKNLETMMREVQIKMGISDTVNDSRSMHQEPQQFGGRQPAQQDLIRPSGKDILKFSGKNVEGWLIKINKFFRHYHIRDEKRLFLAIQILEGEALEWLGWMEKEEYIESWGDFMEDITRRFGKNPYDVPTGRLSKLNQETMSAVEYQQKFENMVTKAHGISERPLKKCI